MLKKLALLAFLTVSAHAAAPRPNIIYILTDDMGWGDYGVFFQNLRKEKGDRSEPWHMTPALDEMAATGMQLPHHYCPAPVCAPSRASLLLGVHQGHSGVRDNQFDKALPDNHTLATVLKNAGYSTAAIGKWGLQGGPVWNDKESVGKVGPKDWPGYPTKRGFDFFHGYVRHVDGHAHYPKEDGKEVWENEEEISAKLDKSYTTDLFTARAKAWISDQKKQTPDKPFFLYLAYDTPHAKIQVATGKYPEGGGLKGGLQWTGEAGKAITSATGTPDSYIHPDYADATWDDDKDPATPEVAWPDVYQRYASMVRRIDECVGDLTQTLKDLGIDENTLVVFTTDNGPSQESYLPEKYEANFFNSFGPFDGIKRDVLEGGIRTGAIARWPGHTDGGRISGLPCQAHDWLATFAELAGMPAPANADGTSLVPTLTGKGEQKTPQVYVEYLQGNQKTPNYAEFEKARRGAKRGQMQAIRFGNLIGMRYRVSSHADPFEIYDVVADPKQLKDLAPDMPEMQEKMQDAVLRMRRPEASAERPYDDQLMPSLEVESEPGIVARSYTTTAPYLARLDDLKADSEEIAEGIKTASGDWILFSGYVEIPGEGSYTFHLPARATALLRVHEATVIDSGFAPAEKEISSAVLLAKGKHPIRFYWKKSDIAPSLEISSEKSERQPIPEGMLSH